MKNVDYFTIADRQFKTCMFEHNYAGALSAQGAYLVIRTINSTSLSHACTQNHNTN
jgi:hypothetical protein